MHQNERKAVLHVIGQLKYGGAEQLLDRLTKQLVAYPMDVWVLSIEPGGTLVEDGFFRHLGPRLKREDFLVRHEKNLLAWYKFWRVLCAVRPDFVHFHFRFGHLWMGPAAKLWGILGGRNIHLVETIHNTYQVKGVRTRMIFEWIFYALSYRQICISRAVLEHHRRLFQLPERKLEVIYNGVPLAQYPYRNRTEEIQTLVSVGNLFAHKKGYEWALPAFARLKTTFPRLRYRIIGDGPVRHQLQNMARELGLEGSLELLGHRKDVPQLLDSSDLFFLPSSWEGFGLVVVEAMSSGLPVVATRVGGVPEILQGSRCGYLVEPRDIDSMVAGLSQAIEDVELRREKVRLARARSLDFTIEKMAAGYWELYSRV